MSYERLKLQILRLTTHAPETGAINLLEKFVFDFWLVCYANLVPVLYGMMVNKCNLFIYYYYYSSCASLLAVFIFGSRNFFQTHRGTKNCARNWSQISGVKWCCQFLAQLSWIGLPWVPWY